MAEGLAWDSLEAAPPKGASAPAWDDLSKTPDVPKFEDLSTKPPATKEPLKFPDQQSAIKAYNQRLINNGDDIEIAGKKIKVNVKDGAVDILKGLKLFGDKFHETAGKEGEKLYEDQTKPMIEIPRIPEGIADPITTGVANALAPAVSGLTSKVGLGTLPLSVAGRIGKMSASAIGGLFSYDMLKEVPQQVREAYRVVTDPKSTVAEKTEALLTPGITALMGGAAGVGSIHEGVSSIRGNGPAPLARGELGTLLSKEDSALAKVAPDAAPQGPIRPVRDEAAPPPIELPKPQSLVTTVDSLTGQQNLNAANAAINQALTAPKPTAPAPEAPAKAIPTVMQDREVELLKTREQRELALKAQDPETYDYLQEQRQINGVDKLTDEDYHARVKDALKGLKREPEPVVAPVEAPKSVKGKRKAKAKVPTPEEDAARYPVVQSELSRLTKEGKTMADPEVKALLTENEVIKNRNEGMPPGQKSGEVNPFRDVSFAENPLSGKFTHSSTLDRKNPLNLTVAARTPDGEILTTQGAKIHAAIDGVTAKDDLGFVKPDGTYLTREEASAAINSYDRSLGTFILPKELSGAKPKYGYKDSLFDVTFKSDLDKALYIISQKKPSKADAKYLQLVMDHLGLDESEARSAGTEVRAAIKRQAEARLRNGLGSAEALKIPVTFERSEVPAVAKAAVPVKATKAKVVAKPERIASKSEVKKEDAVAPELEAKTEEVANPPRLPEPESGGGGGAEPPAEPPVDFLEPTGPDSPTGLKLEVHDYKPGLTKIPGLGEGFALLRKVGGIVDENINAANRRLSGVLREYEFGKSETMRKFEDMSLNLSKLARRAFTKKGIDLFGQLLMNGEVDMAKRFAARHAPNIAPQIIAAIEQAQKANEIAHQLQLESRGEKNVGHLENYFARKMKDYAAFKHWLDGKEDGVADKAIEAAETANGKPLTTEQKETVLNELIRDSAINRSKPGYLKSRTIEELDSEISRFYEPFDVAMESHFQKVTNDYYDRKFFGKNPEAFARGEGLMGAEMLNEINHGRLNPDAQRIVVDNLRARFALRKYGDGLSAKIGEKVRLAQTAAYLGQLSVALAQFGDIINTAFHTKWYDPRSTIKGYVSRKFSLEDINLHKGNLETAKYGGHTKWYDQAVKAIVHVGTGLSDAFNKEGMLNAFADHFSKVFKDENSSAYLQLRQEYASKYPTKWKKMFEDIKNRDFEKGHEMSREAKMFLFDQLSNMHPLNASGMAQGYNMAPAWARPVYGLKSYWLKQIGNMRRNGYELMKDPATRAKGISYLAAYALFVAAGQNVAMEYIRDLLGGKKFHAQDAFVGGLMQVGGLSRYNVDQAAKGHIGDAALSFLLPAGKLVAEAGHDLALTRDMIQGRRDKQGLNTVRDIPDLVHQSQLIRHTPVIGSLYYDRYGAGHTQEMQRRLDEAKGKPQKTTLQALSEYISPPDKTTNRQ